MTNDVNSAKSEKVSKGAVTGKTRSELLECEKIGACSAYVSEDNREGEEEKVSFCGEFVAAEISVLPAFVPISVTLPEPQSWLVESNHVARTAR